MSSESRVPDFDDMFELSDRIKDTQLSLMRAELELDSRIDTITREVMSFPKYFVNGKAPSMEYVKSTYHVSGLDGELIVLRGAVIDLKAELDSLKTKFQVMRDIVTVYVTDSANRRASVV